MSDFNSTSPDLQYQVDNNETKTHYERRLDSFPTVSEKTWKLIIDTENNVTTILIPAEAKQETEMLSKDMALEGLTDKEISEIDKKYSLENLDWVLKYEDRKWFVEASVIELYKWKFNDNNDVIIWNTLIKKWTEKYNKIMIDVLEDFKVIVRALKINLKSRENNNILKKDFINKLKETTSIQNIKEAIDKETIKVIQIYWKDKLALSLKWNDLDYIFDLDWKMFFNLSKFKNTEMVWDMININLKDKYWITIQNWDYTLNWKKINIDNPILLKWILEWVNIVLNLEKLLYKEIQKREK